MKKEIKVTRKKLPYIILGNSVNGIINVQDVFGLTGLFDLKREHIIGEMKDYTKIYKTSNFCYQIFYQDNKKKINIYDISKQAFIVDNWEVDEEKYNGQSYVLKSPIDEKLHLFDSNFLDIFETPLDAVSSFDNHKYLKLICNGKCGLYYMDSSFSSLLSSIDFDGIEFLGNVIIFNKGNLKSFQFPVTFNHIHKMSSMFTNISLEKNDSDIIKCQDNNRLCFYDSKTGRELLELSNYNDVNYLFSSSSYYKHDDFSIVKHNFLFFETHNDKKKGLICCEKEKDFSELLKPEYDVIEKKGGVVFLKKDGKYGLFIGDSYINNIIEPQYVSIDCLGSSSFALYYDDKSCDIVRIIHNQFHICVEKCEIAEKFSTDICFRKGQKIGLFSVSDGKIIESDYDEIRKVDDFCFILSKDKKVGLSIGSNVCIPVEKDNILLERKDNYSTLLSIQSGDKYDLASMCKHMPEFGVNYIEKSCTSIRFLKNIILIEKQGYFKIYNYVGKLIKCMPVTASIKEEIFNGNFYYVIDDEWYQFINGELRIIPTQDVKYYSAEYGGKYVVETCDSEIFGWFCETVDSSKKPAKILQKMFANRSDYPSLSLEKKAKSEGDE